MQAGVQGPASAGAHGAPAGKRPTGRRSRRMSHVWGRLWVYVLLELLCVIRTADQSGKMADWIGASLLPLPAHCHGGHPAHLLSPITVRLHHHALGSNAHSPLRLQFLAFLCHGHVPVGRGHH
jgi:hypothetical protein